MAVSLIMWAEGSERYGAGLMLETRRDVERRGHQLVSAEAAARLSGIMQPAARVRPSRGCQRCGAPVPWWRRLAVTFRDIFGITLCRKSDT